MIGIRADEQRRVAKITARGHSTESTHETMRMPLAEAGVTVLDVSAFWQAQSFDLDLLTVNGRTLEGNCDLCPEALRPAPGAHQSQAGGGRVVDTRCPQETDFFVR